MVYTHNCRICSPQRHRACTTCTFRCHHNIGRTLPCIDLLVQRRISSLTRECQTSLSVCCYRSAAESVSSRKPLTSRNHVDVIKGNPFIRNHTYKHTHMHANLRLILILGLSLWLSMNACRCVFMYVRMYRCMHA